MEKFTFSVDKMSFIEDIRNTQFGVFKLFAFASGNNAHDLPVSVDTLKNTAHTIYNKPVVWKYEWYSDDAGGHEEDEVPCGFVYKENNPLIFKKLKDGRVMLIVNALIWKKYSGRLMEIFQRDDSEKSVSVEIEVYDTKERKDGKTELIDFVYAAITILGEKISPAIPLAKAQVIQFSKDKEDYTDAYNEYFENKYENINFKIPKVVKDNVKKGFELKSANNIGGSTKILSIARFINNNDNISAEKVQRFYKYIPEYNFSEIKESEPPTKDYVMSLLCGGENGIKWIKSLYNEIMEENNKISKYFEESNKDLKMEGREDLKKNMDNVMFNSQTYGELRSKIDLFLNDFKDEDGYCKFYVVDMMLDKNTVIIRDMSSGIYLEVEYKDEEDGLSMYLEDAKEIRTQWTTDFSEKEEMSDDSKEEEKEEKEEMSADSEKKEEEKEEEMSEDSKEEEEKMSTDSKEEEEEEEKMSDDSKEEEMSSKEEEEKEEMSEGSESEDASMSEECEFCKSFKFEIEKLKLENESLIQYKNESETEKKNFEVERTLNEIKEKCPLIPSSEIDTMRASAVDFSMETIDSWKNAVKAKAWNFSTSDNSKDSTIKIGLDFSTQKEQGSTKSKLWA